MTKEQLIRWIDMGLELEFDFDGTGYYVGAHWDKNNTKMVCFYEYYNDALIVPNVDALWETTYKGINVGELLTKIPESGVGGRC